MVGRRRNAAASSRRAAQRAVNQEPDVYQEMLDEAGVTAPAEGSPERPLKRRRLFSRHRGRPSTGAGQWVDGERHPADPSGNKDTDDAGIPQELAAPQATVQTLERGSEDEEEELEEEGEEEEEEEEENEDDADNDSIESLQFEDVETPKPFETMDTAAPISSELELNLSAHQSAAQSAKKSTRQRRRPLTKEERKMRIDVHRMHLLCLLSHAARRNQWCSDGVVQQALRRLLPEATIDRLNPKPHLSQFGQAESLRRGLKEAADVWKTLFRICERGLRRALWADNVNQLREYQLPNNMDSCLRRADFRQAARELRGSRDVGAQLYCALLRSVGVKARLVCSLQPLPLGPGPCLPTAKPILPRIQSPDRRRVEEAMSKYRSSAEIDNTPPGNIPSPRRRLGHPRAADFHFELPSSPPKRAQKASATATRIRESGYPVYWVEVLDVGHQKWKPADPVVLQTLWRPRAFEPPATEKENCLSYVVAFEADGIAKDVTRRYAKAFTAKTRKLRVESALEGGHQWWHGAMQVFGRKWRTNLDQIEDNELAAAEAREPMPRNVQDFKDHPVYALERHMRRNEVLVPGAKPSGTVTAGSRGGLERVYRRKDVRMARSADKWYRLGRQVKENEIPAKWLPSRERGRAKRRGLGGETKEEEEEEEVNEGAGAGAADMALYMAEQTTLYEAPAVKDGRIPKNRFGNVEVFVPSMIPPGAVHIEDEASARAAFLLGVDYAPALTGFRWRGRQGTAVLQGIVVAAEYEEGVRAVVKGLAELEHEMEEERKRRAILAIWRRFLMGLRIRERIWRGVAEPEDERELDAIGSGTGADDGDEVGGGFVVES